MTALTLFPTGLRTKPRSRRLNDLHAMTVVSIDCSWLAKHRPLRIELLRYAAGLLQRLRAEGPLRTLSSLGQRLIKFADTLSRFYL